MSTLKPIIIDQIANCLKIQSEQVDLDQEFFTMGLDSLDAMKILTRIQATCPRQLEPTLLFEYDTVNKICGYLASDETAQTVTPATRAMG